jgi:hypothetical protein
MRFQKGNKVAKGGLRNPPGGRPSNEERKAKQEMLNAALDALKVGALKAVLTLTARLESEDEAIAVRAATVIVDFALKAHQAQELETRISALEARLEQRQGGINP